MGVMTAGVHFPRTAALVGHVVGLIDGERIHIGAYAYGGAGASRLEKAYNSRFRDAGVHVEPETLEVLHDEARGFMLLVAEFGIHVNGAPGFGKPWQQRQRGVSDRLRRVSRLHGFFSPSRPGVPSESSRKCSEGIWKICSMKGRYHKQSR